MLWCLWHASNLQICCSGESISCWGASANQSLRRRQVLQGIHWDALHPQWWTAATVPGGWTGEEQYFEGARILVAVTTILKLYKENDFFKESNISFLTNNCGVKSTPSLLSCPLWGKEDSCTQDMLYLLFSVCWSVYWSVDVFTCIFTIFNLAGGLYPNH